jgi:hypothetical protein
VIQQWWLFEMPNARGYAPGATQDDAIAVMARNCYAGAPVREWATPYRMIGTRVECFAKDFGNTG